MNAEGSVASSRAHRRQVDADNPWPGLEAFSEADEEFFHGRRAEATALVRMVLRKRLTVLFGASGLGKTSLLQAGLFPRLRRERVLPISIRFDFSAESPGLAAQIKRAINHEVRAAQAEAPAASDNETLWEYFHRRGVDFWSPRNRLLLPLLVFDQFEEIFTLGYANVATAADCATMLNELADLVEGHPPTALKVQLDEAPGQARSFVFGRHHYKVLLSLREDFLPELEEIKGRIPSIALNRMRLRRMDGEAALRAVDQAPNLISSDVAKKVVRFVAAAEPISPLAELEVEPALLSVVCRELNRKRGKRRITADLIEGSQEEILAGFYERSLGDLEPDVQAFVEDGLLTVSGYRDSVALENAQTEFGVTGEAINQLVDRRLLRVEDRAGLKRVELTHDCLTKVITTSRDRRRLREANLRKRRLDSFFSRILTTWLKESSLSDEEKARELFTVGSLLSDLSDAQLWGVSRILLTNKDYLSLRQDPDSQSQMEKEFTSLLMSPQLTDDQLTDLLEEILSSVDLIPDEGRKVDWLDTFAYWISKALGGKSAHVLNPRSQLVLREKAHAFDTACGKLSRQLAETHAEKKEYPAAIVYAEKCTWVFQRAGDFEIVVEACRYASELCSTKGVDDVYRYLGNVEFMRLRAHSLMMLASLGKGTKESAEYKDRANQALQDLTRHFPDKRIKGLLWPAVDDWKEIERHLRSRSETAIKPPKAKAESVFRKPFSVRVVSSLEDCVGAIHIVHFFLNRGGMVEWIHHAQFKKEHFASEETLFTVLIGGPKTRGISQVADEFRKGNEEEYHLMYSGLVKEPFILRAKGKSKSCFMLGGSDKIQTLVAAYRFTTEMAPELGQFQVRAPDPEETSRDGQDPAEITCLAKGEDGAGNPEEC